LVIGEFYPITQLPNPMDIETWLETAIEDAERRGLPELKPLLEGLAQATRALRAADFNDDARGEPDGAPR
jgi:hypothetical protein